MSFRQLGGSVLLAAITSAWLCVVNVESAGTEMSYVIDPFETIQESIEVVVYNDEGYIHLNLTEPGEGLFGERALKVDYKVAQTENWGGFVDFGWILKEHEVYNCMGAAHLSLRYKILEKQSSPGRVHLRIIASDGSDCTSDCAEFQNLEAYYTFQYILDSASDGEWFEMQVPLVGDGNSGSPFWRTGWVGQVGNDELDPNHLKGFHFEFSMDSQGEQGSSSSGSLLLGQFACVGGGDLLGAPFFAIKNGTAEEAVSQGSWSHLDLSSPISRNATNITFTDGKLLLDYFIERDVSSNNISSSTSIINVLELRHVTPGVAYYNLSGALRLNLDYQALVSVTKSTVAQFGLALEGEEGAEVYQGFADLLESSDGTSDTLNVTFLASNPGLDVSRIKGFRLQLSLYPLVNVISPIVGGIALHSLAAVLLQSTEAPDVGYSGPEFPCPFEHGLHFDETSPAFTKKEFLGGQCCETCDADDNCLFAISSTGHCFVASYLEDSMVRLQTTAFSKSRTKSFVTTSVEKRGDYCETCECIESNRTIDCRGKDLAIAPLTFSAEWPPEVLDFRENPRLILIDSLALTALSSSLTELRLPKGLLHLAQESVTELVSLEVVDFEAMDPDIVIYTEGASSNHKGGALGEHAILLNNVIMHASGIFGEVCCGRGYHVNLKSPSSGLTFCDMKVDVPGVYSIMEPFVQFVEADVMGTLRQSSPFLSEAAESPEKCAEFCAISEGCYFFSYDARWKEAEHTCYLLRNNGTRADSVCCEPDDYADDGQTVSGWTSGRPPRTRHEMDKARVVVGPTRLIVDSGNDYTSRFEVSLGSYPLRGAVWIESMLAVTTELDVLIFPKQVALYDDTTSAWITVTVSNTKASMEETLVITQNIISCDTAFGVVHNQIDNTVYLDVDVNMDVSSSSSSVLLFSTFVPLVILFAIVSVFLYIDAKRRQIDSLWSIKSSELHFRDPPEIIGRGTFGFVLLGEYHGTLVAVKRVVPPNERASHLGNTSPFEQFKKTDSLRLAGETAKKGEEQDLEIGLTSSNASGVNIGLMSGTKNRGIGPSKSYQENKRSLIFGDDSYAQLKKQFIAEMRVLSKLRHPCVTTVIGAVINPKEEPLLIMEYMDHGSLYDLLHNETVVLEGEQILPILRDVAQGLRFLHAADPLVIHGDLKAQNILVSSTFRAKVCDFGLSHTRNNWLGAVGTPYWMAPELLRGVSKNTTASDVYSFGIMLFEVYSRRDPYEGEDYKHVLRLVRDPAINKRPPIPEACTMPIASIMADCLTNHPVERPTFEELDLRMKGMELSGVEPKEVQLSYQIDKERQLRQKDGFDLGSFPTRIIEAMKEGRKMEPESHEMVTICFSDVIRVGDIMLLIGQEKTSDLLDRVYSRFDQLSREYDVFKVETVGDSYMVVSNLAKNQPDHARRVVEFASRAIKAANETLIDPDNPDHGHAKVRVGFHSGPVVANVVGTRKPRYCIFGDTVNTVFHMERDSVENRIQCSELSAKLVHQQYPETSIRSRGILNIKGKGEMRTYWVNDRDSRSETEGSTSMTVGSTEKSGPFRVKARQPKIAMPSTVTVTQKNEGQQMGEEDAGDFDGDPTKSTRRGSSLLQLMMKYRNCQNLE